MKKRELRRIFAAFLMASTLLSACNTSSESGEKKDDNKQSETSKEEEKEKKQINYPEVYKEAITELDKSKENKAVDFDKVTKIYTENLQTLVQARDSEFEDKNDDHIKTALQAGKDGSMDKVVVRQIFDKLMQKVFYTSMKHDFTEVDEKWGKTEEVNKEISEAKEYYSILQSTVEKRDAAYSTNMVEVIAGGFDEMENAFKSDDKLAFQLGKQVVDKTLMKTFYLATGAIPNGYASKASAEKDKALAKVEQAEGWAFYQSIFSYLNSHSEAEAAFINNQFDLQNDAGKIDPAAVNKAFVRGFSHIALDEYKESLEAWGEDKSPITALEGALFINVISEDIKGLIGEAEYNKLNEKAQNYLAAAKAKDKKTGEPLLKEIQGTLQTVIEKAK